MPEPNNNSMQDLKPTVWIGKQGCTATMIDEIVAQLKKRKLIKVKWLQNTDVDPEAIATQAKARLIEVRGRTMVLSDKGRAPGTPSTAAKSPAKVTAKATACASIKTPEGSRVKVPARSSAKGPSRGTTRPAAKPQSRSPPESSTRSPVGSSSCSPSRSPSRSPAKVQAKEGTPGKRRQTGAMQRGRK